MKTLTIKLTAPLQSYGNEATFERRTTNDYPTKSAVIGMVAAALGYRRADARIASLNELHFAVRVDQIGRNLTDFQTVEWKKDTRKITYRDYIQDAIFVVALGSENEALIDEVKFALKHPKFQLFLGRRSNAPAGVLQLHEFSEEAPIEVLKQFAWQAAPWYQRKRSPQTVEVIADADLISDHSDVMVKDRIVSFDQRNRRYGFRAISRIRIGVTNLKTQSDDADTQHDIMGSLGEE